MVAEGEPTLIERVAAAREAGWLKAPFPAFGGKSRLAPIVWTLLGVGEDAARNYVEPFFFSGAMLWKRPDIGAVETVNDLNAYVTNFWRAVAADPNAVADHADWPVIETDLHARHAWLVGSDEAVDLLERVRRDPLAYDTRIAGWWAWGACCWIGSGWCDDTHRNALGNQRVFLTGDGHGNGLIRPEPGEKRVKLTGNGIGCGVHAGGGLSQQSPRLSTHGGMGVNGPSEQIPHMDPGGRLIVSGPNEKRPAIGNSRGAVGRPQLADQFARGRGVNGCDRLTACGARRAWLRAWIGGLSDRLRPVRVCCGHWDRICDSPSTMTRLGTTAVFLDPPYRVKLADGTANRASHIYANDKLQDVNALCDEVQDWCLRWGDNPDVRIALCGLEGEYPKLDALVGDGVVGGKGWSKIEWKSGGGYGNRSEKGKENAARERVWISPHCVRPKREEAGLFGGGGGGERA